ncbi:MAG TPA: serine/threonine-protein kinase [Gemmatimonadales bacterium]|nr:serine/threonine-protein kinase [Gemmatimonadales bacterium]
MTSTLEQLRASLSDRYQVEREIGAGGMATVYLAQDLKHRRQVAIKVLRGELAEAMGAARFRREIEIAASLHHPHILPLFDSGEAGSGETAGLLYFVMPFEEGETLRARLTREGKLPVAAATRLLRDVADALAHAHARGVVHRDIKPENVIWSGQHALVTDFGIAKALAGGQRPESTESTSDLSTSLTQVGTSLGTPTYMAPEQVAGDPNTDHRADIYALGIMIYEALAGSPPFTGTSAQQILAAHLAQAPEPLSARRPDVPPALAAIVMRCIEKEPTARWQSAADLVTAVEQLEGSGAVASIAAPRKRWPWIAAAVAAVLAVGGVIWVQAEGRMGTLIGNDVLAADDQVLVAEFTNRSADSTLGATVTDAIRIELQESPVVQVISQATMWDGMTAMTLTPGTSLPDAQVRDLAERLGAKVYVVGDVAPLGGGYQLTARAFATVDGTEALTVRSTAANDAELIGALNELGQKLRRGIGESIRSVAAAPELAHVVTASLPALKAYTAGVRFEDAGERPRAITLLREAVTIDSTFASAWGALGVAYMNNSNWPLGMDAITHAYDHREGLPDRARASIELHYYTLRGETDRAEAIMRRRTELNNEGWTSYADLLLGRGRLVAAESAAVRGVIERPKAPVAYWNLVEAQVAQRRFAAADSTLALMADSLPGNSWIDGIRFGTFTAQREFDSARTFATTLPPSQAGWANRDLCGVNIMTGQLGEWHRCRDEIQATNDPHAVLAELRLSGDTARARRQLAHIDSVGVDSTFSFAMPDLIATYAEAGMLPEARRVMERWRREQGPADPRYRADSPYALGAIALAEGKFDSAATAFLAWNTSPHLDAGHWYNRGLVEAGMALDRARRSDSALVLYEKALSMPSISGGSYYEMAWYPEVLRRLGELYEARGDRDKAIGYYSTLSDLWKNADTEMQPQLKAVRARIAALAGEN